LGDFCCLGSGSKVEMLISFLIVKMSVSFDKHMLFYDR
jgi:hypothetical protein